MAVMPSARTLLLPFALLVGLLLPVEPAAAREKPNFIVLLSDDQGYADVPWHGSAYKQPHLEKLAREGLRLEANYVHPMCSPTRCALLSGRYASRFGVTAAQNQQAMPFGTPTLASMLKEAGYATALVGKWHLGSKPEQGPQKFGFDFSYGSLAGGCGPFNHRYKQGEFSQTWHRNGELIEAEGHVTDLIAQEAVRWLEARKQEEPFFLYVPFTAIHIPMDEPEKWRAMNAGIADPGDRLRAACASQMDDAIGQIMAVVEKRGWGKDTLVLFMGDNGAHQRIKNWDTKYPGTYPDLQVGNHNAPWRGQKTDVYEGGMRTPAVAWWPGRIKPGGETQNPVHVADWAPTLLALAKAGPKAPVAFDGIDVAEVLEKPQVKRPERPIYSASPSYRARMLRLGDWKLVVTQGKKKDAEANASRDELYNLASDPGEQTNVAAQHPDVLAKLKAQLADISAADQKSAKSAE